MSILAKRDIDLITDLTFTLSLTIAHAVVRVDDICTTTGHRPD